MSYYEIKYKEIVLYPFRMDIILKLNTWGEKVGWNSKQ